MTEATFLDSNEILINMGPQHPATHGVLRVKLKLDGEKVVGSECVIGYLHRVVEKIAENRTYQQFAPYVDRMDYVAAISNGMESTRVILAELNRMASHQLWLGTHALDIGAMTPLFYTFRDREEILKIFEKYCGARLTTHAFRIGGTLYETYEGFEQEVNNFVKFVTPKIDEYEELLTTNRIWVERTRGVGILSGKDCIAEKPSDQAIQAKADPRSEVEQAGEQPRIDRPGQPLGRGGSNARRSCNRRRRPSAVSAEAWPREFRFSWRMQLPQIVPASFTRSK